MHTKCHISDNAIFNYIRSEKSDKRINEYIKVITFKAIYFVMQTKTLKIIFFF